MTKEKYNNDTVGTASGNAGSSIPTQSISRRAALRTGVLGGIGLAAAGLSPSRAAPAQPAKYPPLKGRINHSVAYWPFRRVMTLDEFCVSMKQIGYSAISHCPSMAHAEGTRAG